MTSHASSCFLTAAGTTTTRLFGLPPKPLILIAATPIPASKFLANNSILSYKLSFRFSTFRSDNVESLLWRKSRYTVLLANSTEGDNVKKKTKGSEADSSQGPPVLTILAGFIVLFLIFWILGSIIMWLVGLIVNVPSPK